jgi:hypothetical protein
LELKQDKVVGGPHQNIEGCEAHQVNPEDINSVVTASQLPASQLSPAKCWFIKETTCLHTSSSLILVLRCPSLPT